MQNSKEKMKRYYYSILIGFAHAKYHRHLRKLDICRQSNDIISFKKHVHAAEDAWKKIIRYKQKLQ